MVLILICLCLRLHVHVEHQSVFAILRLHARKVANPFLLERDAIQAVGVHPDGVAHIARLVFLLALDLHDFILRC